MTDEELPCDPDQKPLPPITPEELDALAGDMEAMYLERGDPSPEEAVAIYRAADEIRRLRKPLEKTTMSQPDTLIDDLKRVAAAAPTFGGLLNRAADEIHGLSALLHRTEHEAGEEIRRLRSEVASRREEFNKHSTFASILYGDIYLAIEAAIGNLPAGMPPLQAVHRLTDEFAMINGDNSRLRDEVATLQAQATTYWNAIDDLVELGEEALSVRPGNPGDERTEAEYRSRLARGRAALAKPST